MASSPFALDGLDDVAMDHDLSGALETQCKTSSPPSTKPTTSEFCKRHPRMDDGKQEEEMRLFAVSDVHIESPENQQWLHEVPNSP